MNHTSSRFISLIMAVIFLLSAAGVSFNILFRGVDVNAVDTGEVMVYNVEFREENGDIVSNSPVDAVNSRYPLYSGKYQVKLTVHDGRYRIGDVSKSMRGFEARFKDTDAFKISGAQKGEFGEPFELYGVGSLGIGYTVTFQHVVYTYRDVGTISFNLKSLDTNQTLNYTVINSFSNSSSGRYPNNDDDDDESSSSKADIEPPTPTIIVSKYDYGGGVVTAASDFTLRIRFTNTSKRLPVDNIVMKVAMPDAFTMTNSSNTFYIEKLAKESSLERELSITVKPSAEPISQVIKISFTYEAIIEEKRKQLTAEQEISIPVSQLDRFSFTPIEAPPEIYVGDSSSIEAKFVNKGKSTVFNVTAEILGNISQPGQRQFIGNIESGKEETADFLIEAKEAGEVQGEVVITYEDANMRVTTLRQPFNAMAKAMDIPPPAEDAMGEGTGEPPEPETWYGKIPVWTWVAGGAGLLIVMTFISKLVRHYREKKLLEDDDEDF